MRGIIDSRTSQRKESLLQRTGWKVRLNVAGTPTLAQQVIAGAEADVFLSADEHWADVLVEKQLVALRRRLLGNHLVLIVPAGSQRSIARLEDLAGAAVE